MHHTWKSSLPGSLGSRGISHFPSIFSQVAAAQIRWGMCWNSHSCCSRGLSLPSAGGLLFLDTVPILRSPTSRVQPHVSPKTAGLGQASQKLTCPWLLTARNVAGWRLPRTASRGPPAQRARAFATGLAERQVDSPIRPQVPPVRTVARRSPALTPADAVVRHYPCPRSPSRSLPPRPRGSGPPRARNG
jgi:hypothetical protein